MSALHMFTSKQCGTERTIVVVQKVLFLLACATWILYNMFAASLFAKWMWEDMALTSTHFVHTTYLLVAAVELMRIWKGEYGKSDAMCLAILIILICGGVYRIDSGLVCGGLLIFCARKFDIRWTCLTTTCIMAFGLLLVIVCSAGGVIQDVVLEQDGGSRIRHCLGFRYPLYPAQYLLTITLVVCWLRAERIHLWELAIFSVMNILMYHYTDSRISFFCSLLAIFAALLYKWCKHRNWNSRGIFVALSFSFIIACLFTVFIELLYGVDPSNTFINKLNPALIARIRLGIDGINEYGVPPFGQVIAWRGAGLDVNGASYNQSASADGINYIDNAFIHIAIEYGWVYALAIIAFFTIVSLRAAKEHDYMLVLVIAIVAIHCIVDDLAVRLTFNTLMFIFAGIARPFSGVEGITLGGLRSFVLSSAPNRRMPDMPTDDS